MKKNKKPTCMITVLAAVIIFFPLAAQVSEAEASTNGKTAANAITWAKSQVGKGIDYDGFYGNQCVDLIKAYYAYLGVVPVYGNGADYTGNSLPSGWTRLKGVQPKKGDILVYTGGWGGYGHVAIYESDYSTYHQNYNSNSYVQNIKYKYNSVGSSIKYWGVIRPDFAVNSNSVFSTNKIVSVTGVKVSSSSASLYTGRTKKLTAVVSPSNASNKKVTWTSSNPAVAKVDTSGKVTAVKKGKAVITASSADGNKKSSCVVTVKAYTGIRYIGGKWVYVKADKPDKTYTGVAKSILGKWMFVRRGVYDTSFTGVAKSTSGNWVFVKNGKYYTGFTGVAKSISGNWVYVKNGRYNTSFTGVAPVINSSKKYYVVKGRWQNKFTGTYGKYKIKNGVVV